HTHTHTHTHTHIHTHTHAYTHAYTHYFSPGLLTSVRPSIRRSGPAELTVTRGTDVMLECEAEGVPRPAITWLKDVRPVNHGNGAQVLSDGRLVQFGEARSWD